MGATMQNVQYDERHIRFQDVRDFTVTVEEAAEIINSGSYVWAYIGGEVAGQISWHHPEAHFNSLAETQIPRCIRTLPPGAEPQWIIHPIAEGPADAIDVQMLAMRLAAAVSTRAQ